MDSSSASSGARRPQPTGIKMRACANCSRLKMKCRWPAGSAPAACTRCDRLGIVCSVPAQAPRKRRAKSNRVAQLEQKLDGIMSLLESNQRVKRRRSSEVGSVPTPGDASSPPTPDSPGDDLTSNNPWQLRIHHPDSCPNRRLVEHSPVSSGTSGTSGTSGGEERPTAETVVELVPGLALTFAEAAEHLAVYRRDYMPLFPFVVVEEGTTPQELHRAAPALFWMLMAAVAQTEEETDGAVKRWLRHHVAETMIIKQEKTLGLLQAILVHLIWGSFHFYIDAETPLFMQLAHNIVLDLKLDWPPEQGQVYKNSLLGAAWCHMNKSHILRRRKEHTPAEIRAVLGLHYATSVTMSMFRRGPGLAWNSYLTKCCDSIAALCQHPLDKALAASVRLQCIAQKGLGALPGTEYVWGPSGTAYGPAQEMTLTLTRDNMDKFVNSQTPEVQNDVMFRHLYLALLVRLYEPVLGMQPAAGPPDNAANATSRAAALRRTEMLWRLVDACRALFAVRAALPDATAALRPSTLTGFLAFAVVTASRALFHAADDWAPAVARRAFDFGAATLAAAAQFDRAEAWARAAGRRRPMHAQTPLFTLYAQKLRWIHQWYEARSAADEGGAASAAAAAEQEEEVVAMITPPEEEVGAQQGQGGCAVDEAAGLPGLDMLGTDQQPIPSFLPDFQFDEAFWQDMLLGTPQPAFGQYNMGNGEL